MGTDGRNKNVTGRGLHDGATGGHGIASGAGGTGHHYSIAADPGQETLLREYLQPHHTGNGALGDNGIVQRNGAVNRSAIPQHGYIQHHTVLHGEAPILQISQAVQFIGLQLRHKAQAT